MPLALQEQALLARVNPPDHDTCLRKAREFCNITGRSAGDLADLVAREFGHCSRVAMLFYLRDEYSTRTLKAAHHNPVDQRWMDARVWGTITKHWPKSPVREFGFPLETKTSLLLKHRLMQARCHGAVCLEHGHVGTEKSFWLENIVAERMESGKRDVIYIYCDEGITPLQLLHRIAREFVRLLPEEADRRFNSNARDPVREALLEKFAALPAPPAIVVDEAQHFKGCLPALETLRGLWDRSARGRRDPGGERPGCGVMLAGSHELRLLFEDARVKHTTLGQWNDRFDYRDTLRGMEREEALRLAAAILGNGKPAKLRPEQADAILHRSLKPDPYTQVCANCGALRKENSAACACNAKDWKMLEYFSARALVKYCEQQKPKEHAA